MRECLFVLIGTFVLLSGCVQDEVPLAPASSTPGYSCFSSHPLKVNVDSYVFEAGIYSIKLTAYLDDSFSINSVTHKTNSIVGQDFFETISGPPYFNRELDQIEIGGSYDEEKIGGVLVISYSTSSEEDKLVFIDCMSS